jgi:hypothetical protein
MRFRTRPDRVLSILLLIAGIVFPLRSAAYADGRSLAGTYKDDRVTLALEPDTAADSYRGTIKTGGQTYKVTAHAADGKVTGAFTDPGGNAFDFTATLNGNTLDFTTANTTYHLASDRPPPVNPLARPQNPLAQPANPLAGGGGAAAPEAPPMPAAPVAPMAPAAPTAPTDQRPGAVGIQVSVEKDGTVVVRAVQPGGPAAQAGIQPGDIIVAVDGIPANDQRAPAHIRGAAGTAVRLTMSRNGQQQDFTLTRAPFNPPANAGPDQGQPKNAGVGFGITIGADQSIVVNKVLATGPAGRAGVQVGDQLLAIDDQPIRGVPDLAARLPGTAGSSIKLTVRRGPQTIDFTMQREVTNPGQ